MAEIIPSFLRFSALLAAEVQCDVADRERHLESVDGESTDAEATPMASMEIDLPFEGSLSGPGPYGPYRVTEGVTSGETSASAYQSGFTSTSISTTGNTTSLSTPAGYGSVGTSGYTYSSTRSSILNSPVLEAADIDELRSPRQSILEGIMFPTRGLPTVPVQSAKRDPSIANVRPSREWYALLAGLLTRAALEGYLVRGWKGVEPLEVLFGVGRNGGDSAKDKGKQRERERRKEKVADDELDNEFEPDAMPSLKESARILFGSRQGQEAQDEFEAEMEDRLAEFLLIPPQVSDLTAHLEELCKRYPAEPVERAALRFCEAAARGRGRPELNHCKAPRLSSQNSTQQNTITQLPITPVTAGSASSSLPHLLHPPLSAAANVVSRGGGAKKSPVERYFIPSTLKRRTTVMQAAHPPLARQTRRGSSSSATWGYSQSRPRNNHGVNDPMHSPISGIAAGVSVLSVGGVRSVSRMSSLSSLSGNGNGSGGRHGSSSLSPPTGTKRPRDESTEDRERATKKPGRAWAEDWPGPYGL